MTANAQTLYVRYSTEADLDKIVQFYQDNKNPYVFQRERDVWKERAAAGAVTLIEDADGKIQASSISYPIITKNDKDEEVHKWTEIGSTLIALEGTGLFRALISAQVVRAHAYEAPSDGFVLEIVKSNQRSIDVFRKIGGKPFDVPADLFAVVQETFAEGKDRKVDWFRIGAEELPDLKQNVGELSGATLTNKHTKLEFVLDFSRSGISDLIGKALAKENIILPTFQPLPTGQKPSFLG